jgi:hypothetical protein
MLHALSSSDMKTGRALFEAKNLEKDITSREISTGPEAAATIILA